VRTKLISLRRLKRLSENPKEVRYSDPELQKIQKPGKGDPGFAGAHKENK
jgi:hypothetical protein